MYERPQRSDELYHWGSNGKHKYIKKIGQGKDTRYFYTMDEVKAYMQGAKKGIGNAVNSVSNTVGLGYKLKMNNLDKKSRLYNASSKEHRKNQKWYNEALANDEALIKGSSFRTLTGRALNKGLHQVSNNKRNTVVDDAARRYARVHNEWTMGAKREKKLADIADKQYNDAVNERIRTKREYNKSLLGKAEKGIKNTKKEVSKAAKNTQEAITNTKKEVSKAAKNTQEAINKTINNAIKSAKKVPKDIANNGKDFINRNIVVNGHGLLEKPKYKQQAHFGFDSATGETYYRDERGVVHLKRKKTDKIV